MSRMNRTRSKAAGVEAPQLEAMAGDKGRGAAAAAKSRHSRNQHAQLPVAQDVATAEEPGPDGMAPKSFPVAGAEQAADLLHYQHSIDENAVNGHTDAQDHLPSDTAVATKGSELLKAASQTRNTPAQASQPKAAQPKASKLGNVEKASASAEQAAHGEPPLPAEPVSNLLSTTLASVAQTLAASRQRRALPNSSTADPSALKQIDLDDDFPNESGDSDFEPGGGSDPDISDVEVIDLSQEDPLDVVQQADGLLSIRSPEQAAAAAPAVAEGCGTDDDEEEFQHLAGKGKRKQPAKAAAAEKGSA